MSALPYWTANIPLYIPVVLAIAKVAVELFVVVGVTTLFKTLIGWYGLYLATDILLSLK